MPDLPDLLTLTRQYLEAKKELETVEREYELTRAKAYLSSQIQGYGNVQSRDAACTMLMEGDFPELMSRLYDARGKARELYFIREAVIETAKEKRQRPFSE